MFGSKSGYTYQDACLLLAKNSGEIVSCVSDQGCIRDTYLECTLKEGEYNLFTHLPLHEPLLCKSYFLTCYGVSKPSMEPSPNENALKEVCKHIIDKKVTKGVKCRQLDNFDERLDPTDSGKITRTLVQVVGRALYMIKNEFEK